jgi:hypothetical protein
MELKRKRYMDRCDPVLRFRVGEEVECRVEAQGFEKSWYKAQIVQIKDGSIKVEYPDLEEVDEDEDRACSFQEWVKSDRLRPFPPELAPEDYLGSIEVGDCVEMHTEAGWRQMQVRAKELPGEADVDPAARMNRPEPTPEEAAAARFHVAGVTFAAEHKEVPPKLLRPVWVWSKAAAKRGTEEEGVKEGDEVEGIWTNSRDPAAAHADYVILSSDEEDEED